MKSKRLLIFIGIAAALLVLVICLSAIFTVKDAWVNCHNFDGTPTDASKAPTINQILEKTKGKNIIFLNKEKTLAQLQTDDWHAVAMVKHFPNKITVHFVKRALAVKIVSGGQDIYIDSKGYVMDKPENASCVDITSAFGNVVNVANCQVNQPLTFTTEQSNAKLKQVLDVIISLWCCKIEMTNIPAVIGSQDVFAYDGEDLLINMQSGAKIVVKAPSDNLHERLVDAFSVYYNAEKNLQRDGVVITVRQDGKITTNK